MTGYLLFWGIKRPGWTHLPDLLAHDGEHPEIQHILGDGRTGGWGKLEIHQQHIGKQQEEEEIHQDVAQKWGHRCKPELAPSWHYKRTLWRSLWRPCRGEGRHIVTTTTAAPPGFLSTLFFFSRRVTFNESQLGGVWMICFSLTGETQNTLSVHQHTFGIHSTLKTLEFYMCLMSEKEKTVAP